jgi:hypothetical protein
MTDIEHGLHTVGSGGRLRERARKNQIVGIDIDRFSCGEMRNLFGR